MKKSAIASVQYQIGPGDLEVVLAMVRGATLAGAGERLGVDASTVFRGLRRLERHLGQALFERTRAGYRPLDLATRLARSAEEMEAAVEAARSAVAAGPGQVAGTVRVTTTDTILHGLVAPALATLRQAHPLLEFELHTGNELASLSRRDADVAVRATRRPPQHVVGRCLGPIRMAIYGARRRGAPTRAALEAGRVDWIGVDDALPEHPSVVWRRRHYPRAVPRYRVSSVLSVLELVALGIGVGIVPVFLGQPRGDLRALSEPLEGAETDLWLLTHPESRHLRRVAVTYAHLAGAIAL